MAPVIWAEIGSLGRKTIATNDGDPEFLLTDGADQLCRRESCHMNRNSRRNLNIHNEDPQVQRRSGIKLVKKKEKLLRDLSQINNCRTESIVFGLYYVAD